MRKYVVEITETLQKQIEIEASSAAEAIIIAKKKYREQQIVLDADHHTTTAFEVQRKTKSKDEMER